MSRYVRNTGRHAARTRLSSQLMPWWLCKAVAPIIHAAIRYA